MGLYFSMLPGVGKSQCFALLSVLLGVYWKKFYLPHLIHSLVYHAAELRILQEFGATPWKPKRVVAVTCDIEVDK